MEIVTAKLLLQNEALELNKVHSILFYFTCYSFFGWIIENVYSKLTTGLFWKEGFFKGPFKPMYGIAPILVLLFIHENSHWFTIILLAFFVPTLVEYVTGYVLRELFQQKWWDYSQIPLQLNGLICLPFSICWTFLILICIYFVHPYLYMIYKQISVIWSILFLPFLFYFIAEVFLAIKRSITVSSPSTNQS